MTARFPCICCGFVVFDEPQGSFEICPVCGWQDDPVQAGNPTYEGGANRESLCHAQRSGEWNRTQPDLLKGYMRFPNWRPLSDEVCSKISPPPRDASVAWSPAHVVIGLPTFTHTIDPARFIGDDENANAWSLLCQFDPSPAIQGNPSRARVQFLVNNAPHDQLIPGSELKLFERATGMFATVHILQSTSRPAV